MILIIFLGRYYPAGVYPWLLAELLSLGYISSLTYPYYYPYIYSKIFTGTRAKEIEFHKKDRKNWREKSKKILSNNKLFTDFLQRCNLINKEDFSLSKSLKVFLSILLCRNEKELKVVLAFLTPKNISKIIEYKRDFEGYTFGKEKIRKETINKFLDSKNITELITIYFENDALELKLQELLIKKKEKQSLIKKYWKKDFSLIFYLFLSSIIQNSTKEFLKELNAYEFFENENELDEFKQESFKERTEFSLSEIYRLLKEIY
jgi:hypothetical protein